MISRCHLLIRQSSVVIKSLAPRVSKFQNLQPAVRRRKRFILIPSSLKDEWTKEMREATMRNGLLLDQQVKTSEKLRESMTSLINSNNSVVRAQKDMMLQQETANQRVNMLIDTVRNLVDAIKRQSINITPPIQNKILEKFKMTECKPQETPMITRQAKKIESKNPEKQKEMITPFHGPFREAIGSLLYLAGVTRPDIAYAVNLLSRRQIAPTTSDWTEVKRIFRYLRGSINEGLVYRANGDEMKVYTDSSFGDCEESKSTSGYIIKLFDDTVAWRSKKQTLVTRSTCGAEYYAMRSNGGDSEEVLDLGGSVGNN
uniref:Reverse transcriptase Ty1/copia-type domain-containing protein n=1 Tax=Trichogramma kaykai TaxID=54128 RepID=A0ABD2X080_9HYME